MQNIGKISIVGLAILTLLVIGDSQYADAWPSDSAVNVALCTASDDQLSPQIVADNAGGAIIVWEDGRGSDKDIYVRRVNASGTPLWASDGVVICNASGNQESPQIVSDGSSGAIITWQDYRNGNWDIYVQRINSNGERQWTPSNGVPICTYLGAQTAPQIASDGASGAIITWTDGRSNITLIYAQRVDSSGNAKWTTDGVSISADVPQDFEDKEYPQIISDGAGGAIIAWEDFRPRLVDRNIYAQRVNSSDGSSQWTTDAPICTAGEDQSTLQLISDGSQGAILAWEDFRDGNADIYAQRVDSSGTAQWTPANGVSICTESNNQVFPQLISDGSGGAIITWEDWRNGNTNKDIYARKVDADGTPQWTSNGNPICTSSGNQVSPQIISDGASGAIIAWQDVNDIYAQRVNSSGTAQWTPNGVAISTASNNQYSPQLVSDGSEGAIVTWQDYRNGSNWDIYAQRVFSDSSLPVFLSSFTASVSDGQILLRWRTESEIDNIGWNIYRKPKKEGEFVKINADLIPGAGNSGTPQEYQYLDTTVETGATYHYYLENIDIGGIRNKSQIIQVTVGWALPTLLPTCTTVFQNFPNPFNPETMIPYQLAEASLATIEIYDANGQLVRMLSLGRKDANFYLTRNEAAYWDGRNEAGEKVASGIYFYRLKTNKSLSVMKKMAISK
jgi:predicted lipoprotein with Yx(FWY)xxD motif